MTSAGHWPGGTHATAGGTVLKEALVGPPTDCPQGSLPPRAWCSSLLRANELVCVLFTRAIHDPQPRVLPHFLLCSVPILLKLAQTFCMVLSSLGGVPGFVIICLCLPSSRSSFFSRGPVLLIFVIQVLSLGSPRQQELNKHLLNK